MMLKSSVAASSKTFLPRRAVALARPIALAPPRAAAAVAEGGSCGSTEGTVLPGTVQGSSGGCGKGSCGSCGSGSAASSIAGLPGASASGSMNTMMAADSVGLSREDITSAFQQSAGNTAGQGGGERIINVAELLASCPPDLIWEDEDADLAGLVV